MSPREPSVIAGLNTGMLFWNTRTKTYHTSSQTQTTPHSHQECCMLQIDYHVNRVKCKLPYQTHWDSAIYGLIIV